MKLVFKYNELVKLMKSANNYWKNATTISFNTVKHIKIEILSEHSYQAFFVNGYAGMKMYQTFAEDVDTENIGKHIYLPNIDLPKLQKLPKENAGSSQVVEVTEQDTNANLDYAILDVVIIDQNLQHSTMTVYTKKSTETFFEGIDAAKRVEEYNFCRQIYSIKFLEEIIKTAKSNSGKDTMLEFYFPTDSTEATVVRNVKAKEEHLLLPVRPKKEMPSAVWTHSTIE